MFLKLSKLKKLMKESYKTCGLWVGHRAAVAGVCEESYYISGGWWLIDFHAEYMPKEVKAAVIELSGDLPEVGKLFVARNKEAPQYEFESPAFYAKEISQKPSLKYEVTNLSEDTSTHSYRYLYCDIGPIRLVENSIVELIDIGAVDTTTGECYPVGPYCEAEGDRRNIVWKNNTTILVAFAAKSEDGAIEAYRNSIGQVIHKHWKK